jgi:hypothetical protein
MPSSHEQRTQPLQHAMTHVEYGDTACHDYTGTAKTNVVHAILHGPYEIFHPDFQQTEV